MNLSRNAGILIEDLAKHHDHPELTFNENGMISIRLNEEVEIAIAYSPDNDAFLLFGIVDPTPDVDCLDWAAIFRANAEYLERQTRLSLDEETGYLIIERDLWVDGLAFADLMNALDAFIDDFAGALHGDTLPTLPCHRADTDDLNGAVLLWL
jgi:Tir chaperone family protein CesT